MTSTAAYYAQAIDILLEIQSNPVAMQHILGVIAATNPSVIVKAKNRAPRSDFQLLKSKLDVMVYDWGNVRESKIRLINLREYCRNNNLDHTHMIKVAKGKCKTHKKYKCFYYKCDT